ncbi:MULTISPECIES: FAD-binding oxidoreductase [Rhodococcus]|uniref:Oxidoreductase n=2 Tax=Rhodococcus TaxID=1827 RepID=A0A076EK00_RHOOP|nr:MULTISPECIES: FAD-binding oxidoreductase [Rhodococcus]AII05557.1 oxidoreductase [Rhodococcus opacus]WAM16769.1 FAD-binding oxidoreductase [Rhodococcus sp. JS3073]GAF50473.1 putative oxidoreductase [Rhodococcus wratislaviensis NBRC 100605]
MQATQTTWTSTVVEHHRLRHDLAVVRLVGDYVPFAPGQYVDVSVPQNPRLLRRLSPALPPSLDGKLEFHVRTVPGGWVSGDIVTGTSPGDQWQILEPRGTMSVDEDGPDVIMIAGGTGLAPFRSILLDLSRRPNPPRVFLFTGDRTPRDLYASDMLYLLLQDLPWLTVIPVVENVVNPDWTDEWYERTRVDVGFTEDDLIEGSLPDVVTSYGAFTEHQVLVCGSAAMVRATLDRLRDTGTPTENIQFDPY